MPPLRFNISVKDDGSVTVRKFGSNVKAAYAQGEASAKKFAGATGMATQAMKYLGAAVAGMSIVKLVRMASEWEKLAATQEKADAQLRQSIRSMGRGGDEAYNQQKRLASGLQSMTTFGDEAIQTGLTFLNTYRDIGNDVLPQAAATMTDLAALMGGDMKQAANMVGKASMGMTGELRRLGITVDAETYKLEGFAGVLREIDAQVGGQARALRETYSGAISALGNTVGDVQEKLGGFVNMAKGMAAGPMIDAFQKLDEYLGKIMENDIKAWAEGAAKAFLFLARTAVTAVGLMTNAVAGWEGISSMLELGIAKVEKGRSWWNMMSAESKKDRERYERELNEARTAEELVRQSIVDWANDLEKNNALINGMLADLTFDPKKTPGADGAGVPPVVPSPAVPAAKRRVGMMEMGDPWMIAGEVEFGEITSSAWDRQEAVKAVTAALEDERRAMAMSTAEARAFTEARRIGIEVGGAEYNEILSRTQAIEDYTGSLQYMLRQYADTSKMVAETTRNFLQGVQSNLAGFFQDVLMGNMKSLGDYLRGLANLFSSILSQMLAQMVMVRAAGFFGGMIGAGAGGLAAPAGGWWFDQVPVAHSGWSVGSGAPPKTRSVPASTFRGAPRLHDGLMADEYPAILQRGEQVIPRGQSATSSSTTIINALDMDAIAGHLVDSRTGRAAIINVIGRERSSVRRILGGV